MRSLLAVEDLNVPEIVELLDAADALADKVLRGSRHQDTLTGKVITTAFFEPSTRTRVSFEAAARFVGADVVVFDPATSSGVKGESLVDTARTLAAIGTDLFVIRHNEDGAAKEVDDAVDVPVVNGGTGRSAHPTQTLLDLLTIRRHFGHLENLRIGIVGDIANSRVAAGLIDVLPRMGATIALSGPSQLMPEGAYDAVEDLDLLLPELDVAYFLRVQSERGSDTGFETASAYAAAYGMTLGRMDLLPENAIVMHPGPMNRGVEISDAVADHVRCLATTQVALGVPTRMAVLLRCMEQ